MKSCFEYCSTFPCGFKIKRWQIIRLWKIKGLFECFENAEMIKEIKKCIKKLVSIFIMREDEGSSLLILDIVDGFA